ncbi:363_t:CDS:2 [Ambispora gerdemannii]|uniref:363_t:CDS:1 n=1 Tax=Ambispora gerdemannii TaxID=144530 RepID=A0A9N9DDZ9_9GLOM|nr:363_t:CDS:2 [Ambispora gerdemannii]
MSEVLETKWIDSGLDWSDAKSKAYNVEGKLKGDNPILYKSPSLELKYNENYYSFKDVKSTELSLPSYDVENNPDNYLKPLDIVKVHVPNGWKNFLKFLGSPNKVVRLHPVVPYKHKDKVISSLAESVEGAVKYFEKRGRFRTRVDNDGKSNNCEHFVNLATHGVDISEFTEKKKVEKGHEYAERNKYYSIENKISESNSFFSGLTSSYQGGRIRQIGDFTNSGTVGKGIMYEGINMDARVEVEPKSWYRLN